MKHRFLSSPASGVGTLRFAALGAGALALAALAACSSDAKLDNLEIRTLSNRARPRHPSPHAQAAPARALCATGPASLAQGSEGYRLLA